MKENKYNKALLEAKEFLSKRGVKPNENAMDCVMEFAYKCFPELDPKNINKTMKKEISNFLRGNTYYTPSTVVRTSWADWLEHLDIDTPIRKWTDYDEKMRDFLITILEVNHPNGVFHLKNHQLFNKDAMTVEDVIAWLKTLR